MARIRTIKPEFWKHEDLSALPEATHLLAGALLNYSDDEGYFNANPALIKAECSPLREPSVSIHESLTLLSGINFLRFGKAPDGRRYGVVVNFNEHQRVNRPTPSKIKDIDIQWDDSATTHGALTEPSPLEGKGKEQGKEQGTGKRASARSREPGLNLHESLPGDTWAEWLEVRRKRRWPVDATTLTKQLEILAPFDTEAQRGMLNTSMQAGWQGVFPPKGPGARQPPKQRPMTAEEAEAMEASRAAS